MKRSSNDRKAAEILHGRHIAAHAEEVWRRDTVAGERRVIRRFEDVQRRWGSLANETLLEIGCGTAVWTSYLVQLGAQVTAVELSEELLKRARQRIPQGVQFVRTDAEHLPFEAESFNKACGLSILHHLDLPLAMREIYRVLKPGGQIWFSEPNMLNPQIMIQKNIPLVKKWMGDTPDETAFFRWPLRRLLESIGFVSVDVQPFDFLHPQLPAGIVPLLEKVGVWFEKIPLLKEVGGSLLIHAQKPSLPEKRQQQNDDSETREPKSPAQTV